MPDDNLTKQFDPIKLLKESPMGISPSLAGFISRNPKLKQQFLAIDPRKLTENDKGLIDDLDKELKTVAIGPRNFQYYTQWLPVKDRLLEFCVYGVTGPVETIIAMILAGAAISRTEIQVNELRPDLDPSLLAEAQKKRNQSSITLGLNLVKSYSVLNITANKPVLSQRTRTLLTDTSLKILRLGKSLSTLSPKAIEDARQQFFTTKKIIRRAWRGAIYTGKESPPTLTAPDRINLILKSAQCDQQSDTTPDEFFGLTYFTYIPDLVTLYAQIDNLIKTARVIPMGGPNYDLNVQPKTDIRKTPLYSFVTGQNRVINFPVGEVDLVQGFGPWHCFTACYEDDNQEYEAVSEVLDQIGDYAGYVSQGAAAVAAISGPTFVTAGAAIVSTAAAYTQVCAEVGEAFVKIANLLDEDDFIGGQNIPEFGQEISDYLNLSADPITHGPYDLGRYQITAVENRIGQEQVTRNWQLRTTQGSQHFVSRQYVSIGISKDYDVEFQMSAKTLFISNFGLNHECKDNRFGDKGHGEWIKGPYLKPDQLTITGEIHVGKSGQGRIRDTAWVTGQDFDKPF